MDKSRSYQLNCSDYVFHEAGRPVGPLLAEVAIAFSLDEEDKTWTLYKHGSPSNVHAWVLKQKKAQGKSSGLADGLHVLEGKIPVDDLNRILGSNDHIGPTMKKLLAVGDHLSFEAKSFKLDGTSLLDDAKTAEALIKTAEKPSSEKKFYAEEDGVTDVVEKPRKIAP